MHELVGRVAQDLERGGSEDGWHLLRGALVRTAMLLACVEGPVVIALWIRGGLCAMVGSLLESARNIDITVLTVKRN